ncbi:MAG: hypothetical protein HOK06_06215 [Rhodospirillaceae bacterium]|jgi:hypothetical protein|nr:hypothetical protein [Rhodospirillaceae bacterium]
MREIPPTITRTPSALAWLAVGLFVVFVQGVWWLFVEDGVVRGAFADGDSYAHLIRVLHLVETGDWFDSAFPRANAPFGTTLHWTRLFDVILIALAMVLTPVLKFADALFWAGVMVSPILHVLAALALIWATMPIFGPTGAFVAGALSAVQFAILNFASVGRADHHMLFIVIGVLAFGFLIRSLTATEYRRGEALAAGLFLALGLWVGPETLLFLALCLAVCGLVWLTGGTCGTARNIHLTLGLTVGLALVLMIERGPSGFGMVEYDRVSVVHFTLALLLLGFWTVAASGPMKRIVSLAGRLGVGVIGIIVTGAVMRSVYPDIFLNPLDQVDPVVASIFHRISEYGSIGDTAHFLVYLGGAIFALPWAVWRVKEEWQDSRRWAWVLIGGAMIVYLVLALDWIRWTLYAGLFLSIPLADLIARVDGAVTARLTGSARVLVKVSAIVFLAIGPFGLGAVGLSAANGGEKSRFCPMIEISRVLNHAPWGTHSRTILASANFGTEILYRTSHKVVSTVHHRNAAGILDGVRILGGHDEGEVLGLVRKRGIDLLLLCPKSDSDSYFLNATDDRILYRRLESGNPPTWLREVELPANLGAIFRLFEVTDRHQ